MHTIRKILLVSCAFLLIPFAASAQSMDDIKEMSPEDRRAYVEGLSEEERTALREKRRAEFESLSDEEKQAMREKRAGHRDGRNREAMRERWESMSEEERAAAKDRRERWKSMSEEERAAAREKRGQHKGQRGDRHHDRDDDGAQPDELP